VPSGTPTFTRMQDQDATSLLIIAFGEPECGQIL
jgi:hypothetical protein